LDVQRLPSSWQMSTKLVIQLIFDVVDWISSDINVLFLWIGNEMRPHELEKASSPFHGT